MNAKKLIQVGRALELHKNRTLEFVGKIKVAPSKVTMTNLNTTVEIQKTPTDGEYFADFGLFAKSLDLLHSRDNAYTGEFHSLPMLRGMTDWQPMNPVLLSHSFKTFLKYCSKDTQTRPQLTSVNFPYNFGVWATDGFRLAVDRSISSEFSFSLCPDVVKVLDVLLSAGETITGVSLCDKRTDEPESLAINYRYICIETNTAMITSRLAEGSLLDIREVLPKIAELTVTTLSVSDIRTLKAAVDVLGVYSNKKTKAIFAKGNAVFVYNSASDTRFKIELPFTLPIDVYMGFNSDLLSELLADITSECTIGIRTELPRVYFQENQSSRLILPLRGAAYYREEMEKAKFISIPLPTIKGAR